MAQYAVLGNPISHSKSPLIHRLFAEQTGQDMQYAAMHVELDQFESTIQRLMADGLLGCNVTVPFKQQAWNLAPVRTPYAEQAGAVNTLSFVDGVIHGTNTDGTGLVSDLTENLGLDLQGTRILLLGAGGAARGILQPILLQQPGAIFLANRTARTAQQLAEIFSPIAGNTQLEWGGFEAITGRFDLIINGTAASLQGDLPPLPPSCIGVNTACYDLMYGKEPTLFLQWAKAHGATFLADGLGMLVEQAAEAFYIWRGMRPETASVLMALRTHLQVS